MRIDESLARGYRRQEVNATHAATRHISTVLSEAAKHGRQRAVPRFKRVVKAFRKLVRPYIMFDQLDINGKHSMYAAAVWYADRKDGGVWLQLYIYTPKNLTTQDSDPYVMGRVSMHAIERLMLRLQTNDLHIAMFELNPLGEELARIGQMDREEWPQEIRIPTNQGEARIVLGEQYFNLVTWVKK